MRTKVAFDISGLAWQYRTGVQNLYWAFVDAWAGSEEVDRSIDAVFYDRSGRFNKNVAEKVGRAYLSGIPGWLPSRLQRPLHLLERITGTGNPDLRGCINHVWNWSIYHPPTSLGSITIPDILPMEFPDWFDSRFRQVTEDSLNYASEKSTFVFAISNDVKQRIAKHTGIPAENIRVVYPGVDSAYFSQIDHATARMVVRKHGLEPGAFLLSSGFLDPRKNLKRQLEGFKLALTRGVNKFKYALTGLRTALSGDILDLIESPELCSKVVFLGYVPQNELIALTSQSAALMYCSIAEGFGLPIVEAMALGAPVITSNNTSMRELAMSRARLVNPYDVADIANAIEELIDTPTDQRLAQLEANKEFASQFTINNWFKGHIDAYRDHDSQGKQT
jgi:glycosyltransferase involved in cell wall biosynthesis